MGMTLGEKIIARAAGVDFVKPNDIHTVTLDRMMSNDGTTHLTVDMYHNKLKNPKIADKDKVVFIMDHNVPAENPKTAEAHKKMRDFAIENDIKLYEGQGVCHQIMMEDYVCPGELIFGADSHTTSYGALGAFGTGVGCTDFLYAMTTGTSWVMVPETIRFNLHGKLREGVYPRDLILTIIGDIGANGANYKIMEFAGDGAHNLSVDDRMVLCNLTVEAGAKAGIVEPDEKVVEYCKAHGREAVHMFKSDEDAHFCEVYDYDLSKIEPVVVRPDFVDNFALLKDVKKEKIAIDEAEKELEHVKIEDEVTDVICDKCGRNMVIKYGPHGKFLGCPGFPECHNTKPYLEKIGVACPKCGKDVILKKTKKGRMFYGCEGYPECDFVSWQKPSDKKCPKCGGYMIEKGSKLVCADETCGYVESKNDKEQ